MTKIEKTGHTNGTTTLEELWHCLKKLNILVYLPYDSAILKY